MRAARGGIRAAAVVRESGVGSERTERKRETDLQLKEDFAIRKKTKADKHVKDPEEAARSDARWYQTEMQENTGNPYARGGYPDDDHDLDA